MLIRDNFLYGSGFVHGHQFVTFIYISDTYIQKAKKTYTDSRGRRNLSALNTELHDVQRIMVQNIDDVLQRGVVMDGNYLKMIIILNPRL